MLGTGWLVFIGLAAAYLGLLYWLVSSGRMQKWNLSLMLGVVLMVRTQRGKATIEWLSRPRRLWNLLADLSIVICALGMLGMTFLLLATAWIAAKPNSGVPALGFKEVFVIPGVNPFVPLWYGLFSLIVTLIVHEGGHGVLARANQMRIKSLGLLLAIVPVGAFVEPDEADLNGPSRRKRLRVFAAGPASNFTFAALFLVLFATMVGSAQLRPGAHIAAVSEGGPAQHAGITDLATITAMDGAPVASYDDFVTIMGTHAPGDNVSVRLADGTTHHVTLTSRWAQLEPQDQEQALARNRTQAEALQKSPLMGVLGYRPDGQEPAPFSGLLGFLNVLQLPYLEVFAHEHILSAYLPAFYDAPFAPGLFWILVSALFWCFWMNLAVGTTNVLPMLPLDGGHMFRDYIGVLAKWVRPRMDPARRDAAVVRFANAVSLVILLAFFLEILGPRLASGKFF